MKILAFELYGGQSVLVSQPKAGYTDTEEYIIYNIKYEKKRGSKKNKENKP